MSALLNDLKFALRMLRKSPGFTTVAVLSLALGIGPNTAIFSLVQSVLFADWGVDRPETLMDIYSMSSDGRYLFTYYANKERVEEGGGDVFSHVGASAMYSGNIERDGVGELFMGEMVTGNYFDLVGVTPALGRAFLPEEDATPGTHPVVVVSDRYWRDRLEADPGVIGRDVRLNGRPYTVIGVAPASFKGRVAPGIGTDFWAPMQMYPHLSPGQMGSGNLIVMARLRPGVTPERARSVLDAVSARVNEARPDSRSRLELGGVMLSDVRLMPGLDKQIGSMATLLFVAVGLVLLVACVNLAGFLLSRATDRRKEMAVRVAMGADRGDLIRQLLVESLVLAALGGALGLVLGMLALRALLGIEPPVDIPVSLEVGFNARLLAFTAGASILAALFFGLTPALQATRVPIASTLRDESGGSAGLGKARARGVMVAAQMALSTVLIFGAALFIRNLDAATKVDVGFDTGPAAVVTVEAWASEADEQERSRFQGELVRRVLADASVRSVGLTGRMPLELGVTNMSFDIPGVEPPPDQDTHLIEFTGVSPDYFDVMSIGVVEGRGFSSTDADEADRVAILTRAAAERFWPGESAVGRVMQRRGSEAADYTVVGVVEDAKIWSLAENPRPYLYVPLERAADHYNVVARGGEPPQVLARTIAGHARAVDPDMFLSDVGTMESHLAYIYFLPRMAALMLSLVGLLALALACVGLYGMVSYAVSRRTREVGIRIALGADRGSVVRLVVRGGLTLVVVGAALGLVAAMGLGAFVQQWLYQGVRSTDPVVLLGAPALLAAVAGLAAFLPARRASRVDPVEALRSE